MAKENATPGEKPAPPAEPINFIDQVKAQGKRFTDAFGERGATYFASGMSFEDAQNRHIADQTKTIADQAAEIVDLQTRLKAATDAMGAAPLAGGPGADNQAEPKTPAEKARAKFVKLYDGDAKKVASAMALWTKQHGK